MTALGAAAHNHPSLARERTALAWARTGLSFLAVVAFAVRAAARSAETWATAAAVAVALAAAGGVLVTRRAAHRSTAADTQAIARDASALVCAIATCGVLAACLVILVMADDDV